MNSKDLQLLRFAAVVNPLSSFEISSVIKKRSFLHKNCHLV